MRTEDVPFAHQLRQIAGWNQTEHDWRGYIAYDPEGCFVAEFRGKPAGTATTIHYGDRFGWIGMVLVHPDQRRFGVGTRLLNGAIRRLQECGGIVWSDGTGWNYGRNGSPDAVRDRSP